MQIYRHKVMLTVCIFFKLTCNMPVSLLIVNYVLLVVHLALKVTMVFFIVLYMHYNHCHRATTHLQLNIYCYIIFI